MTNRESPAELLAAKRPAREHFLEAARKMGSTDIGRLADELERFFYPRSRFQIPERINLRGYRKENAERTLLPFFLIRDTPYFAKPETHCSGFARHQRGWGAYYDATYAFRLTYGLFVGAMTSFNPIEGGIIIHQLQAQTNDIEYRGVRALRQFRWERALVDYIVGWAKTYGIPHVAVQSAEHNNWVIDGKIPFERAKLRYDVTAHRCGFRKGTDGDFHLDLTTP